MRLAETLVVPKFPRWMRKIWAVLLACSVVWVFGLLVVTAQTNSDLNRRLEKLEQQVEEHNEVAQGKNEQISEHERRIASLEAKSEEATRQYIAITSAMDTTKTLLFGFGIPVILLAIEAAFRMLTSLKRT